jgi:putative ABC transport system permease protein
VLERVGGTAGFLARSNTRANGRRVASTVTPLVLTATLTCTMVFSQLTLDSAGARLAARELPADYLLLARGAGGLPPSAVGAALRLPGVAAATGVRSTQIVVVPRDPNDPALLLDLPAVITYPALAIDRGGSDAAFDPHVVSGSLGDLRGDAIAVSAIEALTLGWQVGHRATILLPDGRLLRPRVAAIFQAPPSGAAVNFLLPASAVAGERGQELVTQVYVKMRPGASPARVTAALAGLAAQYPTLVVVGRDAYLARGAARPPQEWLALALLVGLVVAYAAIAIVNTLVMATGERARELALLRLLGATRAQVLRMIGWEATAVIALGLGTAAAITGATLVALSLALVGSIAVSIEPHLLLGVVAGGAGLVWAASMLPARLAMRTPPVVAIGVRE